MIVTDERELRLPCADVKNRREGDRVVRELINTLKTHNKKAQKAWGRWDEKSAPPTTIPGIGLAANQIGIRVKACLVVFRGHYLALINPRIVHHSEFKLRVPEGCLSFPGRTVDCWRWGEITVESSDIPPVILGSPEMKDPRLIWESSVVQHEIAHTQSLLHFDFTSEDIPEFDQWGELAATMRGEKKVA